MGWLTENWTWVAGLGAVFAILYMQRHGSGAHGGHGGGCCGGSHGTHGSGHSSDAEPKQGVGGDAGAVRQSGTSSGHGH